MARNIWIVNYGIKKGIGVCNSKEIAEKLMKEHSYQITHYREVTIEGEITDTMRLDFMIKEEATILTSFNLETRETLFKVSHAYAAKRGEGYFKTPREAIDAAIRSEEK